VVACSWGLGVCATESEYLDLAETFTQDRGIIRQTVPKTAASRRVTPLPQQTIELLFRRYSRLKDYTDLLFPTRLMTLRDPSNTQRQLRDVRQDIGYPSLSTHSFRKPAATMLDRAGMSATEIAAYLGHENPSMTQDVYLNTLKGETKAGTVMQHQLEGLI
jgi:integrase